MKKIALIQPESRRSSSLGIKKSPESLQVLAGQLKDDYNVRMYHAPVESACKDIVSFKPDCVGISAMSVNFPDAKKLAKDLKKQMPGISIVLGGWHVSGAAVSFQKGVERETMDEIFSPSSPFDYGIMGEGDLVFPELLGRLGAHSAIDNLPGLVQYRDGQIMINSPQRVKDLHALAYPFWDGLDVGSYRDLRNGNLDLSVHFNRACRFACGFCSTSSVYGKGVLQTSPEKAVDYIVSLLERFKPNVITFTDEDFFANKGWVRSLVALLHGKKLHERYGVVFDTFASVNDLHYLEKFNEAALLGKMREAGFSSFTIGIESLNPKTLLKYGKEERMILPMMTKGQRDAYGKLTGEEKEKMLVDFYQQAVQRAINLASANGILIVGDYIVGNTGETKEEVGRGFSRFGSLQNLYLAYIPVFTPFPGTGLWGEAYNSGKLKRTAEGGIDWSNFDAGDGAMDLGYDIASFRNQLEFEFYTSERYQKDMFSCIGRSPAMVGMFKSRFGFLLKSHEGDAKLLQILRQLDEAS